MKKAISIIAFALLVIVIPQLSERLEDQGIQMPRVEMKISNVPKEISNVGAIIGLGLLAFLGVKYAGKD